MKFYRIFIIILSTCLLLTSCSTVKTGRYQQDHDSAPEQDVDVSRVPDAKPKPEQLSRYGNPHSYKVYGQTYYVNHGISEYKVKGIASWYGTKFHRHRTSSGEPYDMYQMTAAHKTLPIPSYVRVTNLKNNKTVVVKVNDRGPFHSKRVIDLSYAAAKKLGITSTGTGFVLVDLINTAKSIPNNPVSTAQLTGPSTKHYLQVGSFSQKQYAKNLANKITALIHHPVRLVSSASQANTHYRVQIGPLADATQSMKIRDKLSSAGLGTAVAVAQ